MCPAKRLQERVVEASLPQEARFLRHLATSTGSTSYTADELWHLFFDWRQQYEPGHMYIKGQAELNTKMGVLWSNTHGCTKSETRLGAVIDGGVKKYPKTRTWDVDRAALCRHFGIVLDGDDTQRTIPECVPEVAIPDLEREARSFLVRL